MKGDRRARNRYKREARRNFMIAGLMLAGWDHAPYETRLYRGLHVAYVADKRVYINKLWRDPHWGSGDWRVIGILTLQIFYRALVLEQKEYEPS